VLVHLEAADGAFVLGSTEPHYTPSKVYQAVLAGKPVFAILHQASSACKVIRDTGAGHVLSFDGVGDLDAIENSLAPEMQDFLGFATAFSPDDVDGSQFDEYSARSVTRTLARALDRAMAVPHH
jgi:hypothetical protein